MGKKRPLRVKISNEEPRDFSHQEIQKRLARASKLRLALSAQKEALERSLLSAAFEAADNTEALEALANQDPERRH